MIGAAVLEFADLQRLTKYQRVADVEACLTRQNIRYFNGRSGPWTTLAAVNDALGIHARPGNDAAYVPDEVI
jgi:hypothetical protein